MLELDGVTTWPLHGALSLAWGSQSHHHLGIAFSTAPTLIVSLQSQALGAWARAHGAVGMRKLRILIWIINAPRWLLVEKRVTEDNLSSHSQPG